MPLERLPGWVIDNDASVRDDVADYAGLRIARALESNALPYAIGGALALGAHGVPRGRLDVDVNVFVEEAERLIDCLSRLGVTLDEAAALSRARRDGMFVGRWAGMRVDVFVPSIPFSEEAKRTRVRLTDPDGESGSWRPRLWRSSSCSSSGRRISPSASGTI